MTKKVLKKVLTFLEMLVQLKSRYDYFKEKFTTSHVLNPSSSWY